MLDSLESEDEKAKNRKQEEMSEGKSTRRTGDVRDGICVDPPLCRGTSQGIYGSRFIGIVCEGETVGQIGEVDEKGERELVLKVNAQSLS